MIEEYLNTQGYMLFDGAFGTYYAQRYAEEQEPCEMANLKHPQRVAAIHREMRLRRTPSPLMNSNWNAAGR